MMQNMISYPLPQTERQIALREPVKVVSFVQEWNPDLPCLPRGVSDTSKEAFKKYKAKVGLNEGQRKVYEFIKTFNVPDFTRWELAIASKIEINVITPRVRELLDLGKLVELPKRICKRKNTEMAHALRIA